VNCQRLACPDGYRGLRPVYNIFLLIEISAGKQRFPLFCITRSGISAFAKGLKDAAVRGHGQPAGRQAGRQGSGAFALPLFFLYQDKKENKQGLFYCSFALMQKNQKIKPVRKGTFPLVVVFRGRTGGRTAKNQKSLQKKIPALCF
jgi:hypothetical protein